MKRWLAVGIVGTLLMGGCSNEHRPGRELRRLGGPHATFLIGGGGKGECQFDYQAQLSAVDVATGRTRWLREIPWPGEEQGLAVGDGRVFLRTAERPTTWGSAIALSQQTGQPQWQRDLRTPYGRSDPIAVVGTTAVTQDGDDVIGVGVASGAERWRVDAGRTSSVQTNGGLVFVTRVDGSTVVLDAESGQTRWTLDAGRGPNSATELVLVRGRVFSGGPSGRLVAADRNTGRVLWSRRNQPGRSWSPHLAASPVAVVVKDVASADPDHPPADRRSYMTVVRAATGSTLWRIPATEDSNQVVVLGDMLFERSHQRLVARDIGSGTPLWTAPGATNVSRPEPNLVVSTRLEGNNTLTVRAFDARTGKQRWTIGLRGDQASTAVASGDLLLLGRSYRQTRPGRPTTDGLVTALRTTDGTVAWRAVRRDDVVAPPLIRGHTAIVLSSDTPMYCM